MRRAPTATRVPPIHWHWRIEIAPRLELTVRPERRLDTLERQFETRLAWRTMVGAEQLPTVERIVQRLTVGSERLAAAASERRAPPTATQSAPEVIARRRSAVPATLVRHEFVVPERVVRRPQPTLATGDPDATAAPEPRSLAPIGGPLERRDPPEPSITGIDFRRLTDRVVEALDRRLIAAHERLGRR